jgi:hypothetical protein
LPEVESLAPWASGGIKALYLNHMIYEKMGVGGICKKKAKEIIITVKYPYSEYVIIII